MEATTKVCLYKIRIKKNGKFPVKIRIIWKRKSHFYQTGIDLAEQEFKVYHNSKKLKKQFEDVSYFLKKADQSLRIWVEIFPGENLTHFIIIVNYRSNFKIHHNQLMLS